MLLIMDILKDITHMEMCLLFKILICITTIIWDMVGTQCLSWLRCQHNYNGLGDVMIFQFGNYSALFAAVFHPSTMTGEVFALVQHDSTWRLKPSQIFGQPRDSQLQCNRFVRQISFICFVWRFLMQICFQLSPYQVKFLKIGIYMVVECFARFL